MVLAQPGADIIAEALQPDAFKDQGFGHV